MSSHTRDKGAPSAPVQSQSPTKATDSRQLYRLSARRAGVALTQRLERERRRDLIALGDLDPAPLIPVVDETAFLVCEAS